MEEKSKWKAGLIALAAVVCMAWTTASAQSSDEVEKLKRANRDLESRLGQVEKMSAGQKLTDGQRQEVKNLVSEMMNDAKKEMTGPSWAKNLKFYGDFRLRYEGQFSESARQGKWSGAGNNSVGTSRAADRNRMRFRLRFGFEKKWTDADLGDFEVGFRLASGDSSDPTSTNQTLGSSGTEAGFNKRSIWIDLAYAKWSGKDALKGLSVTGGKMKNPFQSSDMIWDSDVNPEGVWVDYKVPGIANGDVVPFVGAGMFLVREVNQTATVATGSGYSGNGGKSTYNTDTTMWAYNAGVIWNITKDVKWTSAFTYYQWLHSTGYLYAGSSVTTDWRGNYAPAGLDFGIVNLTNKLEFAVPIGSYKLPMEFLFDWAYNTAEKYSDGEYHKWVYGDTSRASSGYRDTFTSDMNEQRNAFNVGITAGKNKKKGDWSVGYNYKWIEANSVPGYWADSDFGFANRRGHVIRGTYNIMDDLTIGTAVYLTNPIHGETSNVSVGGVSYATGPEKMTTTVMMDLIWKF